MDKWAQDITRLPSNWQAKPPTQASRVNVQKTNN